ncbi:MAG TPA: DUF4230 domain-containing protein [Phycisphaerales bacterium]|nr:DUF4230 domain-containing protein [Phycisphaerales bacterium]
MQNATQISSSGATRLAIVAAVIAMLLAAASLVYTVRRERVREAAVARLMTERNIINPADVAKSVRTLKLITVQVPTSVRVETKVESMLLGDASVAVQTPVVVSYGIDLTNLADTGVRVEDVGERTIIRVKVPKPQRQAVEIFAESQQTSVQKGWRRYVWWTGEEELTQAKAQVPIEARALELLPKDREKIEADSREQVRRLVQAIVGSRGDVEVEFE